MAVSSAGAGSVDPQAGAARLPWALEPGAPADLAWLDGNPYAVPVTGLARTGVRATWKAGTLVYEAADDIHEAAG